MSLIDQRFEELRQKRQKALIPYFMSGFPSREGFRQIVEIAQDEGVDLIEIGMPFSDPLADGPVIQRAGQRALELGTTLSSTLEDVNRLHRRRPDVPLLLMSYVNPMLAFGLKKLAATCQAQGVSGWIVPDRNLDDSSELLAQAKAHALDAIPLVAPTTPNNRLEALLPKARGFVYLVSLTGVTGARRSLKLDLGAYVRRVRAKTRLPLCVGFGVASGEQARSAARHCDGIIVGSALLQPLLSESFSTATSKLKNLLRELRRGLRAP